MSLTEWLVTGTLSIATLGFIYWRFYARSATDYARTGGGPLPTANPSVSRQANSSSSSAPSRSKTGKKSILETLRAIKNPKKMILFYGSQTGTAEDLATRIAREVNAHLGVHSVVADVEEFEMTELIEFPEEFESEEEHWLTGFFLATYGEGEPTDSAVEFYDWLMDGGGKGDDDQVELDDDMASEKAGKNLRYISFGLGNKTYEHFNAMGRRVDKRLANIGAVRIGPAGEGDDDGSMEDDFLEWKPKVIAAIAEYFGVADAGGKQDRDAPHVPVFEWVPIDGGSVFRGELSGDGKPRSFKKDAATGRFTEVSSKKRILHDAKNPFFGAIAKSYQLFQNSEDVIKLSDDASPHESDLYSLSADKKAVTLKRTCVHMELDLSGSGIRYEAGDHVGVYAANNLREVDALIRVLHLSDEELDQVCKLQPNPANPLAGTAKIPFPNPCSLRTALTYYLAISAPLREHQLAILAKFASDGKDRDALYKLVDDRNLFLDIVDSSQKNLREVLEAFPSVKVPPGVLIGEVLTHITVRYYSISSSPKKDATRVSLTAVVVRYVLPNVHAHHHIEGNPHKKPISYKEGLATSWIERLHEARASGEVTDLETASYPPLHLPLFIRTSSFRLPRDVTVPVVMIGPGTGVAPFRGFIHERLQIASARVATATTTKPVGSTWLFYGCRHPDQDFLYRDEFEEAERVVKDWSENPKDGGPMPFDLRIITAFSRMGPNKVYVQNKLLEMAVPVWELLDKKRAYIYVCGDAKNMASDVQQTLLKMAMEFGGKSENAAKSWLKDLRSSSRYQEDVW
ncbi:hypothetical protein DFJ73DRAFT_662620 [Zopfochytrium polystomum]|nr:hypothetical protein DFJ73DRAFT_662620 [Zopfochytrium polystomum]